MNHVVLVKTDAPRYFRIPGVTEICVSAAERLYLYIVTPAALSRFQLRRLGTGAVIIAFTRVPLNSTTSAAVARIVSNVRKQNSHLRLIQEKD